MSFGVFGAQRIMLIDIERKDSIIGHRLYIILSYIRFAEPVLAHKLAILPVNNEIG